jgi:DNA-directed RNA polymerase I subunit RPA2
MYLVNRFVLVHTKEPLEKLQTLCIMWQKLMGLVRRQLEPDNQDTMSSHELLLPGQLYGIVLKEAIEVMLFRVRGYVMKLIRVDEQTKKRKKRIWKMR